MARPALTDLCLTIPAGKRLWLAGICGTEALACLQRAADMQAARAQGPVPNYDLGMRHQFASWMWLCQLHGMLDGREMLAYRQHWPEQAWREVWDGLLVLARPPRSPGGRVPG